MIVSIVTPCFNGQELIGDAIHSLKKQTFKEWEYIIVDDGSSDNTAKIVEKFAALDSRIRLIKQENQGVALARNTGFEAANKKTKYIMFLDHDDTLDSDALKLLADCLENNSDYVAAYGLARYSGGTIPINKPVDITSWGRERLCVIDDRVQPLPVHAPTTFNSLILHCYIITPGQALIRRSSLEKVGIFKPEFFPGDDWELWLRLSQHGPIGFVNRIVLNYYQREESLSQSHRQSEWARRKIVRYLLKEHKNSPKKYAVVSIAYKYILREQYRSKIKYSKNALEKGDLTQALKQITYSIKPLVRFLLEVV